MHVDVIPVYNVRVDFHVLYICTCVQMYVYGPYMSSTIKLITGYYLHANIKSFAEQLIPYLDNYSGKQ